MNPRGLALTLTACALALAAMKHSATTSGREAGADPARPAMAAAKHRPPARETAGKDRKARPRGPADPEFPGAADADARLRQVPPAERERLDGMLSAATATEDATDDRAAMRERHRLSIEHHASDSANEPGNPQSPLLQP